MTFTTRVFILISIFFLLSFFTITASSQSIESISLNELEKTVGKPFIYGIDASFPNPWIVNRGSSFLYQPDSDHIQIYDYFNNAIKFTYSINGIVTSVDESYPLLAIGTSKGEVIFIDESLNYTVKKFEGSFGSVTKVLALSSRYVYALFSDGSLIQYDSMSDSWITYRPFSYSTTSENVQQYQVLDIWKDGGNLLLLCSPIYSPVGKIYIQLSPATNETSISGIKIILNFTDTGFLLTGTTDENGLVQFGVPPGETPSSQVSIYISSSKPNFFYLYTSTLGDLLNKMNVISYPPQSLPLIYLSYVSTNYMLYLATPSPSGLKVINSISFTADSVKGLLVEDGSLGFKYLLLLSRGGYLSIDRLSPSLILLGRDTYSRTELSAFDSDSSGNYLLLGFTDGTLVALKLTQQGYNVFHSYKLTSSPTLVKVISTSPLSIITYDGNYLSALIYSQSNYTFWPILRTSDSFGYYVGEGSLALFGTDETLIFFSPSRTFVLDGIKEIFAYNTLDLRTRTLSTIKINVLGEDGSIPTSFSAILKGKITYVSNATGEKPLIFRNVLPDNYTLTVIPSQNIYDSLSVKLSVTGDGTFNISLPLHVFTVTFELIDNLTGGPPKGNFSYNLVPQRGNATIGSWEPSKGDLKLNITYGLYTIALTPQFSSIYPTISYSFSVPENLNIILNIARLSYLFGVQVIDSLTNSPASGAFKVEIIDTLGNVHQGTTDFNSIAYVTLNDVGNMSILISPADEITSKTFYELATSYYIDSQMVKQFSLVRRNYTLTISIIDLDTNIPASGITVKISSYTRVVGANGTYVFELPANTYVATVQGGIYVPTQRTISLYDNSSITIGVRRIVGTLTVRILQSGGTPISNAIINIDGIDNVNSYTFISDYTGEITVNLPLGLYKITVRAADYVPQVQVWNVSSTSPQTVEIRMSYTLLGYFKAYGIYMLIIAVSAILILYMRRYVRRRLDLLAQKELEEEVF
ncbi:MAG: carboxypeptidase-like regulatory domain-containing protein [Fervidicoccaceae archaeon]